MGGGGECCSNDKRGRRNTSVERLKLLNGPRTLDQFFLMLLIFPFCASLNRRLMKPYTRKKKGKEAKQRRNSDAALPAHSPNARHEETSTTAKTIFPPECAVSDHITAECGTAFAPHLCRTKAGP
jgi:hypothetical protein